MFLKNEDAQSDRAVNEYALLSDVYGRYREHPKEPFFLVNAIIGKVTIVDVKQDATSATFTPLLPDQKAGQIRFTKLTSTTPLKKQHLATQTPEPLTSENSSRNLFQ